MNMYFAALVAPPGVNEDALKWKNFFKERFGCIVPLKSPAHITLIPPLWMNEDLEPDFISAEPMHQGIIREFKGIGSFVDPDTNKKIALQEAYLRDYFEGQFGNFLVEASELGLTGNIA